MDGVRALALAPGDATVLRLSGGFLVSMGRQFDEGISAARRAVALDPVNRSSHLVLGAGLLRSPLSGGDSGLCRHHHP